MTLEIIAKTSYETHRVETLGLPPWDQLGRNQADWWRGLVVARMDAKDEPVRKPFEAVILALAPQLGKWIERDRASYISRKLVK